MPLLDERLFVIGRRDLPAQRLPARSVRLAQLAGCR